MAETTNIEWCDATFNPWLGCTKVSPGGCANCYAEVSTPARVKRAAGVETWGPHGQRQRTSAHNWKQPLAWNAKAEREGRRLRVFCASLADVFDNAVPPVWRADLFKLIGDTPHLDWLLLTKRIGNVGNMIPFGWQDFGCPPNVWIGATVVNQEEANRDIPKLLDVPARVRFLSIEPMLGPVYVEDIPDPAGGVCLKPLAGLRWVGNGQGRSEVRSLGGRIDWVICGGESGHEARPMNPHWARNLRDQCASSNVAFLFKQWGEWLPGSQARDVGDQMAVVGACTRGYRWDDGTHSWRIGKPAAGRLLDGITHDGFPAPGAAHQTTQPEGN